MRVASISSGNRSKEESEQQISVAVEFIDLAEKYCMEQLQERKMTE